MHSQGVIYFWTIRDAPSRCTVTSGLHSATDHAPNQYYSVSGRGRRHRQYFLNKSLFTIGSRQYVHGFGAILTLMVRVPF